MLQLIGRLRFAMTMGTPSHCVASKLNGLDRGVPIGQVCAMLHAGRWSGVVTGVVCLALQGCLGGARPVGFSGGEMQRTLLALHLKSGLHWVVETTTQAESVGMILLVDADARWDPVSKAGLSHAVEHLAFHKRAPSASRVWHRLNAKGATLNGWTNFDVTGYYAFANAAHYDDLTSLAQDL